MCEKLSSNSGYLSGLRSGERATTSLPALNAACYRGHIHPVLRQDSSVNLLVSVFRFMSTCLGLQTQLPVTGEMSRCLTQYMTAVVSSPNLSLSSNLFSRHEAELLYWICLLDTHRPALDKTLEHRTALVRERDRGI